MLSYQLSRKRNKYRAGLVCALASLAMMRPGMVVASSIENDNAIKIRDGFAIQLEMQRLNTQLHLRAAMIDSKRLRRTWLWDFGNGSATEGGLIAATCLFWNHDQDKLVVRQVPDAQLKYVHNRVDGKAVAATIYPQIAGQGIGAAGALYELVHDLKNKHRLFKDGYDTKNAIKKMVALNVEFDEVLRNDLNMPESEGLFLKRLRDLALDEFIRLEGRAGDMAVANCIEDGVSFSRNTIGLVGNVLNAVGNIKYDKHINANGNVLNAISASMITIRPFVTNGAAILQKRHSAQLAKRYFPQYQRRSDQIDDLEQALADLRASHLADAKMAVYERQMAFLREQSALCQWETRTSDHQSIRRYRESLYGPSKLAQSILGLDIGFRKLHNETSDNRLAAVGNTIYCAGQAGNLIELARERIADEVRYREKCRKGQLPAQILERQVQMLDTF